MSHNVSFFRVIVYLAKFNQTNRLFRRFFYAQNRGITWVIAFRAENFEIRDLDTANNAQKTKT